MNPNTLRRMRNEALMTPCGCTKCGAESRPRRRRTICKSFANQLRVKGWYVLGRVGTNHPTHRYGTGRPGTGWDGPLARQDLVVSPGARPAFDPDYARSALTLVISYCHSTAEAPQERALSDQGPDHQRTQSGRESSRMNRAQSSHSNRALTGSLLEAMIGAS